MNILNILAPFLSLMGTIIIGIWGFPINKTAGRSNLTCKEHVRCYSGFILLGSGFTLQLVSELLARCQ